MTGLGVLYAFDCYQCKFCPTDPAKLLRAAVETAEEAGLHVADSALGFFPQDEWGDKYGSSVITLVVPLRESHIAIHTWPAHRFVSIDVYTCADPERGYEAAVALAASFAPERIEKHTVWRGILGGEKDA